MARKKEAAGNTATAGKGVELLPAGPTGGLIARREPSSTQIHDLIALTAEVNSDDIVNVGVAAMEEKARNALDQLTEKWADAHKREEENQKQTNEVILSAAKAAAESIVTSVIRLAAAVGNTKAAPQVSVGGFDHEKNHGRLIIGYRAAGRNRNDSSSDDEDNATNSSVEVSICMPFNGNAAIKRLDEAGNVISGEIKELKKSCDSWKEYQTNIPKHERRFKAELAKLRLSGTETGQKILSTMLSRVDTDTEALLKRTKLDIKI